MAPACQTAAIALVRHQSVAGQLDPRYSADPVHLNDAGYAVVAGAMDPSLFQGGTCGAIG